MIATEHSSWVRGMAGVLFGEKIEKLVSVSSSGQVWRRSTEMHLASRRKSRSPVSNLMWLKEETYLVSVMFFASFNDPFVHVTNLSDKETACDGGCILGLHCHTGCQDVAQRSKELESLPSTSDYRPREEKGSGPLDLGPWSPQSPCLLRNEDQMARGCPLPFPVTYLQERGLLRSPSCEQDSSNYCFLLIIFV